MIKIKRKKKIKIKELLALEPKKHYILKFNPLFVEEKNLHALVEWCFDNNIYIFCIPVEDINQLQIQEK